MLMLLVSSLQADISMEDVHGRYFQVSALTKINSQITLTEYQPIKKKT